MTGNLLFGALLEGHREILIALNPINQNLILSHGEEEIAALPYYSIAFARLMLATPIYFLLGFWYSEKTLTWIENRSKTYGPLVRKEQKTLQKYAYLMLLIAPSTIFYLIAAVLKIPAKIFFPLVALGTVARLIAIRWFGFKAGGAIETVRNFIGEYQIPVLVFSALMVVWFVFSEFKGKGSGLKGVLEITSDDKDNQE